MTIVFFDTNIILDLVNDKRETHYESLKSVETARKMGFKTMISPLAFSTGDYIFSKEAGKQESRQVMRKIRRIFSVTLIDAKCIDSALASDFADFEDAIQYYSAVSVGAGVIVTNDRKGFKTAEIDIMSPPEFTAVFAGGPDFLNEKRAVFGRGKRTKRRSV